MKKALLLTLFTLLLHATSGDRFNALKFGQTQNDYILYQPNMQPFETGFTTCAWIRKLYSTSTPTWFSYATSVTAEEIQIGDDGSQTRIFGVNKNIPSVYTVTPGTWFHNCVSWDTTSNVRNVYINGVLVDRTSTTAGRTLTLGGYLVLGNEQDSGPGAGMDGSDIFGGEMFNLNMFSKKLSDEEIKEMARDMCSEVEETYGEVRAIKWKNILLKTRTGTVTEIRSGCSAGAISRLLNSFEKIINETETEVEQIKSQHGACQSDLKSRVNRLNATEIQLNRIEEGMQICQKNLENKTNLLNETDVELERSKEETETCRRDLENKTQQLNATDTQKQTTIEELDTVNMELNSTTTALNQSQVELQHVKGLLGESANATMDCLLNTTITNHWDLLHSEEFFEAVITGKKLEVLRKSMQNLEFTEGIKMTDGMIRFHKQFNDGEDQCLN